MRGSAALAVTAALTIAGLVPATSAAAAKPRHVAIVIAGHGVACVPWHSGITGDEVLNDVATVKYRPTDGLITQIDGTPKNNRADETHYWSYWHNTGSGWRYSTVGASGYHPAAGTVEGWHFINGSSTATPPPLRSYASICHDTVVVAPAPPPPDPTSTAATHSTAPTYHATSTDPATSTTPAAGPVARTGTNTSSAARSSAARPTSAPPASDPVSSTSAAVAIHPTADLPTLNVRNTADATQHTDEGSALPTVLVVAFVLLLGGVAAVVAQRRRRSA